jgi:hypothetical protein
LCEFIVQLNMHHSQRRVVDKSCGAGQITDEYKSQNWRHRFKVFQRIARRTLNNLRNCNINARLKTRVCKLAEQAAYSSFSFITILIVSYEMNMQEARDTIP